MKRFIKFDKYVLLVNMLILIILGAGFITTGLFISFQPKNIIPIAETQSYNYYLESDSLASEGIKSGTVITVKGVNRTAAAFINYDDKSIAYKKVDGTFDVGKIDSIAGTVATLTDGTTVDANNVIGEIVSQNGFLATIVYLFAINTVTFVIFLIILILIILYEILMIILMLNETPEEEAQEESEEVNEEISEEVTTITGAPAHPGQIIINIAGSTAKKDEKEPVEVPPVDPNKKLVEVDGPITSEIFAVNEITKEAVDLFKLEKKPDGKYALPVDKTPNYTFEDVVKYANSKRSVSYKEGSGKSAHSFKMGKKTFLLAYNYAEDDFKFTFKCGPNYAEELMKYYPEMGYSKFPYGIIWFTVTNKRNSLEFMKLIIDISYLLSTNQY